MNWIRNNRFLAGFLGIMILGIGGLGYLLYSAIGQHDQVSQDYDTQVKELKRLQALKPYPDQADLSKYQEIRTSYKQSVDDLQAKMVGYEVPLDTQLTPTQFQDRLRKVVDDVTKAADQVGMAYPADFYLGFERYRSSLPEAGATALLSAQLTSVQELMSLLIKERIDKIGGVKRAVFPQENGAAAAAADPSAAQRGKAPANAAVADLVTKVPVVLQFTGAPSAFRAVMNDITHLKRLFVIRALRIANQVDKGPLRGQVDPIPGGAGLPNAPGPDANAASGEPLPEKGPPPLRYVVGQEKLDIVARIELAKVNAPQR